jgi:hypothetical protein
MNDGHWERAAKDESSWFNTGIVAQCKSVCWFDISATKIISITGRYTAYVRFKHNAPCHREFQLSMTTVEDDEMVVGELSGEQQQCQTTYVPTSPLAHNAWLLVKVRVAGL